MPLTRSFHGLFSPFSFNRLFISGSLRRLGAVFLLACACALLTQCAGVDPRVEQRAAQIAMEPPGDYWIGRRYFIDRTRFWGYLRRPRQPWDQSKLTIINESYKLTPDRLPEAPESGPRHGYDHNYEYRLWGYFSGDEVYDPNSNLVLPEFVLKSYELINPRPGFLFQPDEVYSPKRVPRILR